MLFKPYVGLGPLHFGMPLEEITAALGGRPTVSSFTHDGGENRLNFAGLP
ncbi:hypothetical protein [Streptomyces sp. CB01881]|nr:hypothetical protein [Streptomyces sp. CB01881]